MSSNWTMIKLLICFCFIFLSLVSAFAQKVEVIKFHELDEIISSTEADIQLINFWATWCKPCIQEIPYFEAVGKKYEGQNVKVLLVTLDFVEDLEKKVIPFVQNRALNSEVKLLDETDFNAFIDKIDPSWSGAIPATLLINNRNGKTAFYEKAFKEGELDQIIDDQLKE